MSSVEQNPTGKIRVVVVDDHPVVRDGISTMLDLSDDIEMVGQARDGLDAVNVVARLKPDVVLMDLQMPNMDGVKATRKIRERTPDTEIIILTSYDNEAYLFDAIRAGARGFLLKDVTRQDLWAAIRAANRGESLLQPSVAAKLMGRVSRDEEHPESLTDRELEVLKLMAQGMRNKEIGKELNIAERTVKAHVTNIIQKLGVTTRVEAVTTALRDGLIYLE